SEMAPSCPIDAIAKRACVPPISTTTRSIGLLPLSSPARLVAAAPRHAHAPHTYSRGACNRDVLLQELGRSEAGDEAHVRGIAADSDLHDLVRARHAGGVDQEP